MNRLPVVTKVLTNVCKYNAISTRRAQPNSKEIKEAAELCEVAASGDISELEKLKKKGYSLDSSDYDFRSPLHLAAANG